MAERVTDLRDIRDRVLAELAGLPEPGVPVPAVPSVLLRPGSRRPPTPRVWIRLWLWRWPPRWAARRATPRSSPDSSAFRVVAVDGLDAVGPDRRFSSTVPAARSPVSPDAAAAADAVGTPPGARPHRAHAGDGPGATADGHAVAILATVQDGAAARAARETPAEGVGPSVPNCAS